jgi:crossover junction endodeoxyribonuclease RuvC
MTILSVDPGAHGAIAVLEESGEPLEVHDTPSTPEANGRTATSAPLLAKFLARTHARIAFCEFVGARPPDGRAAAFTFSRGFGDRFQPISTRGVIQGCAGTSASRSCF